MEHTHVKSILTARWRSEITNLGRRKCFSLRTTETIALFPQYSPWIKKQLALFLQLIGLPSVQSRPVTRNN